MARRFGRPTVRIHTTSYGNRRPHIQCLWLIAETEGCVWVRVPEVHRIPLNRTRRILIRPKAARPRQLMRQGSSATLTKRLGDVNVSIGWRDVRSFGAGVQVKLRFIPHHSRSAVWTPLVPELHPGTSKALLVQSLERRSAFLYQHQQTISRC